MGLLWQNRCTVTNCPSKPTKVFKIKLYTFIHNVTKAITLFRQRLYTIKQFFSVYSLQIVFAFIRIFVCKVLRPRNLFSPRSTFLPNSGAIRSLCISFHLYGFISTSMHACMRYFFCTFVTPRLDKGQKAYMCVF